MSTGIALFVVGLYVYCDTSRQRERAEGKSLEYTSATSKAAAVARMYALAGAPAEPLGPGSKEKKSSLEALGFGLGLDLRGVRSKHRCAQVIAERLGVLWDDTCQSAGDTITLKGINLLLDAAVQARITSLTPGGATVFVERLLTAGLDPSSDSEEDDVNMPQVVTEVEQNIADYLARLSESGPVPEDFGEPPIPFSVDEVRFDDGSWRQRLIDVRHWLHLGVSLDGSSADVFDVTLAEGLGLEPSVERSDLLDALSTRLDRALALRDEFWATMDDEAEGTATLRSASLAWTEAWDSEADDEVVELSGSINAEAKTWQIATFHGYARRGELNLSPSYQRADVWPTGDAQKLVESIVRGIPLPSVIILEMVDDDGTTYEVVDGKQRLTSILRFMGAHPRALAVVKEKAAAWGELNLLDTFKADYREFRKLWKKHELGPLTAEVERANQFPFALRTTDTADNRNPLTGDLQKLRGKYYCEVRDEQISLQGKKRRVEYLFEEGGAEYQIPVIIYKEVTTAQVHEVFSLYNRQGKRLNAEEIRNALYHRLKLMRALLVTAGDSTAVAEVAPFLVDSWEDLASAGKNLTGYKFGDIGYKRTKVLSWVTAALLLDDSGTDGVTRSTSAQINALLQRVDSDKRDSLRSSDAVRQAMLLIGHGLDAHAAFEEAWSKEFRSGSTKGPGKWQELRLVASLVALSAAGAVLGDELTDRFEEAVEDVRAASTRWEKPRRNQSREQWRWIGFVVGEILRLLEVDPADAHAALQERFGHSGLKTLVEHAEAPSGYSAT